MNDLELHNLTNPILTDYVRPSYWLPIPEPATGEQRFIGLFAVPEYMNYCSIDYAAVGTGSATIYWGDGTTTSVASGGGVTQVVRKTINYSALAGTDTPRGYRQTIVDVTFPATWTVTRINLQSPHNTATNYWGGAQWLDINLSGASISTLSCDNTPFLERFKFWGVNNLTSFNGLFLKDISLQSVEMDTSKGTDFSYMFQHCTSLRKAPSLTTSNGTNFSYCFDNCSALTEMVLWDTSKATNMSYMFQGCCNLRLLPALNTSLVTSFTFFLAFCGNLFEIPALNMNSATNSDYIISGGSGQSTELLSYRLGKALMVNIKTTIGFSACCLSREAIVTIFNNLTTVSGKTINLTNNWGVANLTAGDRAIATNKGWTITG